RSRRNIVLCLRASSYHRRTLAIFPDLSHRPSMSLMIPSISESTEMWAISVVFDSQLAEDLRGSVFDPGGTASGYEAQRAHWRSGFGLVDSEPLARGFGCSSLQADQSLDVTACSRRPAVVYLSRLHRYGAELFVSYEGRMLGIHHAGLFCEASSRFVKDVEGFDSSYTSQSIERVDSDPRKAVDVVGKQLTTSSFLLPASLASDRRRCKRRVRLTLWSSAEVSLSPPVQFGYPEDKGTCRRLAGNGTTRTTAPAQMDGKRSEECSARVYKAAGECYNRLPSYTFALPSITRLPRPHHSNPSFAASRFEKLSAHSSCTCTSLRSPSSSGSHCCCTTVCAAVAVAAARSLLNNNDSFDHMRGYGDRRARHLVGAAASLVRSRPSPAALVVPVDTDIQAHSSSPPCYAAASSRSLPASSYPAASRTTKQRGVILPSPPPRNINSDFQCPTPTAVVALTWHCNTPRVATIILGSGLPSPWLRSSLPRFPRRHPRSWVWYTGVAHHDQWCRCPGSIRFVLWRVTSRLAV
ncbi:hypothetical protein DFH06DRAFT_1371588, partial [Mycena polygramma]